MSRQPVDLYANSGSIAVNEVDAALMRRRQDLLGPFYRLLYDEPFHPVRAEGVWLFDANGDRYLDAYNNVLKIRPPLPFGREHADLFVEAMDNALRHLKPQGA